MRVRAHHKEAFALLTDCSVPVRRSFAWAKTRFVITRAALFAAISPEVEPWPRPIGLVAKAQLRVFGRNKIRIELGLRVPDANARGAVKCKRIAEYVTAVVNSQRPRIRFRGKWVVRLSEGSG